MTKSLGQIAHEAGWPECEGFLSWENLTISRQVRDELAAQAVAAHVRAENAWQPIKTAPKGKKLTVGYLNRGGNWRSVMACYYLPKTLEAADDCHYGVDEEGYAPEGWYEESETHESILPTDEPPTYWMPSPTPPPPPPPEQLKGQAK